MKDERLDGAAPLVVVARAVKTRGLKGEIVADLLTDFPARFEGISSLIAVAPNGNRSVLGLESYWFQQDRVVLKLAGYDTIETARTLVGSEFAVPESERVQLPQGHFYDWELEGCIVETLDGSPVGHVREVRRLGGGVEMLEVEDLELHRHLIPMVQAIIVEIDIARKRIQIDPPEGLIGL
jgi:16S rRNA processing protein RimM